MANKTEDDESADKAQTTDKTANDARADEAEGKFSQELQRHLQEKKAKRRESLRSLLVCGGCLSVLGAILIPNFISARAQGSCTACKSNLKNIGSALEMYSTDWAGEYPTTLTVLTPNYLKSLPECPPAGAMTYRAYFGSNARFNPDKYEDYYYLECYGSNHTPISITGNYPAYNGIQGLIERAP